MRIHSGMRSRPGILWLGLIPFLALHVIFLDRLRHLGVSVTALTGLVLLGIAKHFGVLGSLYSLFRERFRR